MDKTVHNFKNGIYNYIIMTTAEIQGIIGIILGVSAIVGVVLAFLRYYVKQFAKEQLDDIRHELKPNSGSSMKDQVTRLEKDQKQLMKSQSDHATKTDHRFEKMEEKIDKIFDIVLKHLGE